MPRSDLIDLAGKRFGRWSVLRYAGRRLFPGGGAQSAWLCRCDCGSEFEVCGIHLRAGASAGCRHCRQYVPGERYGTRVLVKRRGSRWEWRCDCGAIGWAAVAVLKECICRACMPPLMCGRAIPITFNGETRAIKEWERHLGLGRNVVHERLRHGWPLERALSKTGGVR